MPILLKVTGTPLFILLRIILVVVESGVIFIV
jgi:hypothetical protein